MKLVKYLGVLVLALFILVPYSSAWWNNSWDYNIRLDMNDSIVPYNLTNVPTYFNASILNQSICDNINQDGSDIRFVTDDNLTELPREVYFNKSLCEGSFYVKTNISMDKIRMYYGNSGASEPNISEAYSVWGDYQRVFLFNGDLNASDTSTSATNAGATFVDGLFSEGIDTSSGHISTGFSSSDTVVSLWFKSSSATNPGSNEFLYGIDEGGSSSSRDLMAAFIGTDGKINFRTSNYAGTSHANVQTSQDYYDGEWHHIAARHWADNGANHEYVEAWVDGEYIGKASGDGTYNYFISGESIYIGALNNVGSPSGIFNGIIDEVSFRQADISQSDNSTSSLYKIQNNNSDFWILGDIELVPVACLQSSSNSITSRFADCSSQVFRVQNGANVFVDRSTLICDAIDVEVSTGSKLIVTNSVVRS